MANTRLYEKWTWNIGLPEPFDKAAHTKSSTDKSKYNTTTTVATYHGPVLQALMEYMEMDTTISSSMSNSAIGTQNEQIIAEYHSRTGQIHVVVFNKRADPFGLAALRMQTATQRYICYRKKAVPAVPSFYPDSGSYEGR